jgi:hypothetical protein
MSVGHGGTAMTIERNKHTVVIDHGGSDNGHGLGRGQWTQELAMTSDVDWIDSRLASACSRGFSSSPTAFYLI